MGANEKHAATYHGGEYTPTTEQVREACILGHYPLPSVKQRNELGADFDRWLETVRAEAKQAALLEAADVLQQDSEAYFKTATTLFGDDNTRYHAYASMLQSAANRIRKRANQYKEGS